LAASIAFRCGPTTRLPRSSGLDATGCTFFSHGGKQAVSMPINRARRPLVGARPTLQRMDRILGALDQALRTLFAQPRGTRPCPVVPAEPTHLGEQEKQHAAALMRVNHVGEICAQALYTAQAMATRNEALRQQFKEAAREE